MRILIVEDGADTQESFELYFRVQGHETEFADNGEEALAKMNVCKPDGVIADQRMPKMTGIELIRVMRAGYRLCDIPVALISGLSEQDVVSMRSEAAFLGKVKYFQKPADPDEVLKWLKGESL